MHDSNGTSSKAAPRAPRVFYSLSAVVLVWLACVQCRSSPAAGPLGPGPGLPQTEADEYTRYELLEPASHKFRITHEFSATTPGSSSYFALVRGGVFVEEPAAFDVQSTAPLQLALVDGATARANGHPLAHPSDSFFQIRLKQPVPTLGEARVRLQVTYTDNVSYAERDDAILFDRTLAVKRLAVVMPHGYEVVACNYPVQVFEQSDGRVHLSLMNAAGGPVALRIVGRKLEHAVVPPLTSATVDAALARQVRWSDPASSVPERAHEDAETFCVIEAPERHEFRLLRDATLNDVEQARVQVLATSGMQSRVSAHVLDTGTALEAETMTTAELGTHGLSAPAGVADAQVVVLRGLPELAPGGSLRLRMEGTCTDPARCKVEAGELVFTHDFHSPRASVLLPKEFYLSGNSAPATVSQLPDGRMRLDFVNPRPDSFSPLIKARRRS